MTITPEMCRLRLEMDRLAATVERDPGDYIPAFELEELKIRYKRLERMQQLGIKLVHATRQTYSSYTEEKAKTHVK